MKNSLTLEKWVIETIYQEAKLQVYSYMQDNPSFPHAQITEVVFEPWLVSPASEKIIFIISIRSRQTSNEEILRLTENVKGALTRPKPLFVIKHEIEEVECFHESNYWQANIEVAYYIISENKA